MMNFNKAIMQSVIRHIIGMVGVWITAKYGVDIDAGTVASVSELVLGLVLSGGALVAGGLDKTRIKPVEVVVNSVDVLKDNPIIVESEPEVSSLRSEVSSLRSEVQHKGFFLSDRSLKAMKGIHKDLVQLIKVGIVNSPYDFVITEGLRSAERQTELLKANKSWTKRSKHQDGLAFDFMAYDENGNGTWSLKYYEAITDHLKEVAKLEGINIECGIDWKQVDAVHVQVGV